MIYKIIRKLLFIWLIGFFVLLLIMLWFDIYSDIKYGDAPAIDEFGRKHVDIWDKIINQSSMSGDGINQIISYQPLLWWVYDAVIVLWSKVYSNNALWSIVRWRSDAAVQLYKLWYAKKILVSADNSTRYYNETDAVYKYLLSQSVPKEDIFLDYAGIDTYDSFYRAKHNFLVDTILVPNLDIYMNRALFIADGVWLYARWVSIPYKYKYGFNIREQFAKLKAIYDVVTNNTSKFHGSDIYDISWTWNTPAQ